MQVPNLMWSELVSHGADSSESGGCNERQSFRDWDIGHAFEGTPVGSAVAPVRRGTESKGNGPT